MLRVLPVIAVSEPRMAADKDVPPDTRRFCTAATAADLSALGSAVVRAPWSNPTTPMSTLSGWALMNATADCCAAANLVGDTSVAAMLLDTSMATMTVPDVRPTGSEASGPAIASASTAIPARVTHGPHARVRRAGGAIPAAASASRRRRVNSTTPTTSAATTRTPTTNSSGWVRLMRSPRFASASARCAHDSLADARSLRSPRFASASARCAHDSLADARSCAPPLGFGDDGHQGVDQIGAGVHPVVGHTGPAHAGQDSRVPLVNTVPEPRPEPRVAGVHQHLLAGFGVLDHHESDLGDGVVRGIHHPQGDDFVAVGQPEQRPLPVAGADEIGDDHDQTAALGQRGDGLEHRGQVGGSRRPVGGRARDLPADPQSLVPPGTGSHDAHRTGVVQHRPDSIPAAAE